MRGKSAKGENPLSGKYEVGDIVSGSNRRARSRRAMEELLAGSCELSGVLSLAVNCWGEDLQLGLKVLAVTNIRATSIARGRAIKRVVDGGSVWRLARNCGQHLPPHRLREMARGLCRRIPVGVLV